MILASLLLVILVISILVYALSTNPKLVEMGKITFACSMLAICLQLGTRMVALFPLK